MKWRRRTPPDTPPQEQRDAILKRLDEAVLEQRRITSDLAEALGDQKIAADELDRAVADLRRFRGNDEIDQ